MQPETKLLHLICCLVTAKKQRHEMIMIYHAMYTYFPPQTRIDSGKVVLNQQV